MSSQTLKDKTIKGVGWSAVDQVSNQGITFLVSLVLARLLSPDEYGLIGIITIFISVFNIFIISGFNAALIRKKNANDRDFNTVFWFNMAVSVVLFGVLWLIAPSIADFFERVELTALIRTMGVLLLINAFALIQTTILTKQIDFKKQTKVSLIASISSGTIGIGMALCGLGVWSLVGQQISRQGFNSLFLWIWSKWRPRLEFSATSFKELWGFGWKLLVSGLLNTIWGEMYQVIVGKFYAPDSTPGHSSLQVYFPVI
jgi:teichuronic acid exporter